MWFWYAISAILIAADQATKLIADSSLVLHSPVAVLPNLNWMLAYNTGAAFSFLSDAGGWQRWFFTVLSAVVSIVLIVWLWRMPRAARWLPCAVALILSGAIGNLIDRIAYGHVVDFVQFYYESSGCLWGFYSSGTHCYWPAFNIADMAISVGAFMLIAQSMIERGNTENE